MLQILAFAASGWTKDDCSKEQRSTNLVLLCSGSTSS
jgi:hypothetical protein